MYKLRGYVKNFVRKKQVFKRANNSYLFQPTCANRPNIFSRKGGGATISPRWKLMEFEEASACE